MPRKTVSMEEAFRNLMTIPRKKLEGKKIFRLEDSFALYQKGMEHGENV